MSEHTRRDFIRNAAVGTAAFLASPTARVRGANDRVRLAMIGVGTRGQELLKQTLGIPSIQVVAVADIYTRRFDEAKKNIAGRADRERLSPRSGHEGY